jgi:hypothetical protein
MCDGGACRTCTVCASGCAHTTLQAAILAASDGSTIYICPGTYATNATIDRNLTVIGAGAGTDPATGAILDGGLSGGVLQVDPGTTVTLRTLTITRGGGPAYDGGGVHNLGTLFVEGVDILKNAARNDGGGIHNEGALTVRANSRIEENSAASGGGGLSNYGTTTLENCRILTNDASIWGGGIMNFFLITTGTPVTTVKAGVEISGNKAPRGGGIIALVGTVTLEAGSTVTRNTATDGAGHGGGVYEFPGKTVNVADANIVTGNNPENCQPPGAVPNCIG